MTTNEVYGVVSISYPLEKLVIDIISEKRVKTFQNEIEQEHAAIETSH